MSKRESYCPNLTRGGQGLQIAQPTKTASCIGGFSSGLANPPQLLALTLSPLPRSLSVSKEVFSHHVLRRHHLDCNILLPNGLVGTPGKTFDSETICLVFLLFAKWLINVFAF